MSAGIASEAYQDINWQILLKNSTLVAFFSAQAPDEFGL
jgi:hypothetical protein